MSVKCVCPECQMSITAPTGAASVTCPICDTPVTVPGAVQARPPVCVVAPPRAAAPLRPPAPALATRRPARRWWVVCLIVTMMLGWLGAAGGGLYYYLRPTSPASEQPGPQAFAGPSALVPVVVATQNIVPPPPPPPPPPPLPPPLTPEQKRINAAIDKGVRYLKTNLDESLKTNPRAGVGALIGLTLLECGVPTGDEQVKQLAGLVRGAGPLIADTYDISLSILFLDRLGDKKDSALIQRLALRLAAGQIGVGMWAYRCPLLNDDEEKQFVAFLRAHTGKGKGPAVNVGDFPGSLQNCSPIRAADPNAGAAGAGGDNSNTQFGVLGLWVALRYKVPIEASLIQTERHFRGSQHEDGSWGYNGDNWPASMTCSGLLGLAIGHSVSARASDRKKPEKDAAIEKGFALLATHVGPGAPQGGGGGQIIHANAWGDLYYLWSLERVGVVYDLKKIGGQDWYEWASKVLVDAQQDDGSWVDTMPGAVDTCFALLVLKRVNVVQDLTIEVKKALNLKDIAGSK